MKVKALMSFAGVCSMCKGEEREIKDKELVKSLVKGGLVEKVSKNEDK